MGGRSAEGVACCEGGRGGRGGEVRCCCCCFARSEGADQFVESRYGVLLKRVKSLRKRKARAEQQLEYYRVRRRPPVLVLVLILLAPAAPRITCF